MECGMHTQDQEIKQEALFITISHHAWSTIYDDNLNNATIARCHIQLTQQSLPTNDRLEDNLVVIYGGFRNAIFGLIYVRKHIWIHQGGLAI